MEIEAKFSLPNLDTFRRLQGAHQLAGFALSADQTQYVRDIYFDTDERLIMAAGYACRRREQRTGVLVTLKRLRAAEGAIHRREELEVLMPTYRPPAEWPASPVRDQVLELIGDTPPIPLFELRQSRFVRQLNQGERMVAELSLDSVHLITGDTESSYFEVEVELASEGTETDLVTIVACLQDEWHLEPETQSKFERALAFLETTPADGKLLTVQERFICQQISERDDLYGRRALALLALDEGATQAKAGQQANLSARRVRHWLAEFRQQRLGIFPNRVLDQAQSAPMLAPPETTPEQEPQVTAKELPQPLSLEALFERYQVDQTHARVVADHALALFDHLRPVHRLSPERRPLLEIAGLVHDVGLESDPGRHHIAGRDILLAHPPTSLDDQERVVVALTTFLHRKRITPKKLNKLARAPFAELPEPLQAETLTLAALVRMADGLDYSQTASSRLEQVRQQEAAVEIEVTGPSASLDANRAQTKSDLWQLLFETDLQYRPVSPEGELVERAEFPETPEQPMEQKVKTPTRKPPKRPGLKPGDPMAEAARKTFQLHFQRMLYHEPGTRLGEDIEELHDMRVATRRMRAAIPVFGDYLDMNQMAPFVKGMRRTGRALGAVRDMDVFWEKTQHYLDTPPPDQPADLDPLRAAWEAQREIARKRMLAYLDSKRYGRFKEKFWKFLQKPGAGALPVISGQSEPTPHRLRHVVPVAVYQRLGAVLAYDEWVTGPDVPMERLHQLRITAKGLRYTLEYFEEVLGPETKTLINEVKGLQDHLGDLQDAVVASNLLRDFLTWGTWGHAHAEGKKGFWPEEPIVAPGVAAYLATRQAELQHLLDTFPQAWGRFQRPEFGQLVASVVAPLLAETN
jgi:CHAD domain-containing protein/inorganic triphosphatase YgiF